jgi:hypothetical protein
MALTWSNTITRPNGHQYRMLGRDELIRVDDRHRTIARLILRRGTWWDVETGDGHRDSLILALRAIQRLEAT